MFQLLGVAIDEVEDPPGWFLLLDSSFAVWCLLALASIPQSARSLDILSSLPLTDRLE